VTHVYAKYDFLEEKRDALNLWGRHLARVLNASVARSDSGATPRRSRRHGSKPGNAEPGWRQSSLFGLQDA